MIWHAKCLAKTHKRSFFILIGFAALAHAQSFQRNEAILGGGYGRTIAPHLSSPADSGASLTATYVLRIAPHIGLEVGVVVALDPTPVEDTRFPPLDARSTWVPFGARYILEAAPHMEMSLGAGGVYQHYSIQKNLAVGQGPHTNWGGSFVASAATPLDRHRHFCLARYSLMASPTHSNAIGFC